MSKWPKDRFTQVSVEYGGRRVHAWRATCKCGFSHDFPWTGGRTQMPPEMTSKKLMALGWNVGATALRDICPSCVRSTPAETPPHKEPTMTPAPALPPPPAPPPSAAPPPRIPTRDDRRRVLDGLEEHWNHDAGCYAKSFTDKSLAEKLNVPRAWVTAIRDEFFGTETNEAVAENTKRLADLSVRTKTLEDKALGIATEAEDLRRQIGLALGRVSA